MQLLLPYIKKTTGMHFDSIAYSGIKGTSGMYKLHPVTIVTGPNGSGKTAMAEAARLAATGTADIGSARHLQGEMVAEYGSAVASLKSGENVCEWRASKKSGRTSTDWTNPIDTQGGLPISVSDFKSMTAEKRWSMIAGGNDGVAEIDNELAELGVEIAKLKMASDAPLPVLKCKYNGRPAAELRDKIEKLSVAISRHNDAKEASMKFASSTKLMQDKIDAESREQQETSERQGRLVDPMYSLDQDIAKAKSLMEREAEATKDIPEQMRAYIGKSGKDTIGSVIAEFCKCISWLSARAEQVGGEAQGRKVQILSSVVAAPDLSNISEFVVKAPAHEFSSEIESFLSRIDQPSLQEAIQQLAIAKERMQETYNELRSRVEQLGASIARTSASLAANLAAMNGLMPGDDFRNCVIELELLQKELAEATFYDEVTSKRDGMLEAKGLAFKAMMDKISRQVSLRQVKAVLVNKIKGKIEEWVNEAMLSVGWGRWEISAVSSGKRSHMTIRSASGIDLSAVAESKQLAIWSTILAAIHEHSGAKCPLMVVEAAEMDSDGLSKLAKIMSRKTKGNVIIAHWAAPMNMPESSGIIRLGRQ